LLADEATAGSQENSKQMHLTNFFDVPLKKKDIFTIK
jgi:hypothetical protein